MTTAQPPKKLGGAPFYIALLLLIFVVGWLYFNESQKEEISLSEVLSEINNEELEIETVVLNGTIIEYSYEDSEGKLVQVSKEVPGEYVDTLIQSMLEAEKDGKIEKFDYKEPLDLGFIMSIVTVVIMVAVLGFFLWISFARSQSDGKNAISFGRSKARLHDPTKHEVSFADVAGADEEKEELSEFVDFLKNPKKYSEVGAKIPRGILLHGAPGTGKTLLARAVAGEAEVPFFSISGSDFVEMFVGVGASRVRDLFENAKKNAPCIVFIDEIDAVGRHRGAGLGGGHDEREQTLNQLLVEMDGFGPNEGVIIIAATNRIDILDPALLRPGRFDRRVFVMLPDIKGREEILKVHSKGKPIADSVDFREVAKNTPGFTGADLANVLNEAALLAARHNMKEIDYATITEATFKVMIGPEKKSRVISDKEKKLTAFHESGHAIVLRATSETDRVERVSIIPAGGAGGYTAHKADEDIYYTTRKQLIDKIMIALGGRAAEELVLGEISTGASSDLQHCNSIARNMITKYGMSSKLKNLVFGTEDEIFLGRDYGHVQAYSEKVSALIDEEVKSIIDEAYDRVLALLKEKMPILLALAKRLLEIEKIEKDEFEEIYVSGGQLPEKEIDDEVPADNDENRDEFAQEPADDAENKDANESSNDSSSTYKGLE
ncbi:MAG: ATP-dependent zinc metalloprotease FtsH [Clostridiales bacterium]|nr:ATP-dependent zinc metalloprotease FtsH [Clostridiales bacterium]